MKVIGTDNWDRDHVADILVRDEMNPQAAQAMADELNEDTDHLQFWYKDVPDDYRLKRGMEDLV